MEEMVGSIEASTSNALSLLRQTIANHAIVNDANTELRWGQFVLAPQPSMQVGVYGSACATIVLGLENCDDTNQRNAARKLIGYITNNTNATYELAHNIKLAMSILAISPKQGVDADEVMLSQLSLLLARRVAQTSLWSAYTKPNELAQSSLSVKASEAASSVIVLLLIEICERLDKSKYHQERSLIESAISLAVKKLEKALLDQKNFLSQRNSVLLALAVVAAKGKAATSKARKIFRRASETHDFADRLVFFYECLKPDGILTRDYFIVPSAVLIPVVLGNKTVGAADAERARIVLGALIVQMDQDGLFKAGQEMASTVEQALVGLSFQAAMRSLQNATTIKTAVGSAFVQLTSPKHAGEPTFLVKFIVVLLWLFMILVVGGRYIPIGYENIQVLGFWKTFAESSPPALGEFLVFLSASWPTSIALFLSWLRRNK